MASFLLPSSAMKTAKSSLYYNVPDVVVLEEASRLAEEKVMCP